MALTRKQRQILDYVESFSNTNGYPPSYAEIAQAFDYSSLATVHEHLTNLEQKGVVRKNYNQSRSLQVVRADPGSITMEVLGMVAAGFPLEPFDDEDFDDEDFDDEDFDDEERDEETVTVPRELFPPGENYVLRVKGDSMIDAQIRDGDYILINQRQTVENGEMVIALVDGEATVKKFYREGSRVRLQPANPTMPAKDYPADRVAIQGVVVAVIPRPGPGGRGPRRV